MMLDFLPLLISIRLRNQLPGLEHMVISLGGVHIHIQRLLQRIVLNLKNKVIENSANFVNFLSIKVGHFIGVLVQSSEEMSVVISVKRNHSSFKNEFHVFVLIWGFEHVLEGLSGNRFHVV